ncbi:MAG TPA: helix-turn-helix transcriptional regulator [Pusillimonas sp.]|uniref:helix-turn-helix domain-containing protein n=1 Tax=unclassified Pusillimonas TaxID=2640016 RepID=UPI00262FAC55|nr:MULTISPECIES: helix-turn-helix transcriptional regulator [unclassified Pusillimonas]HLU19817.1 helix-turn-helix transcriptional regulator [Pusillimonas sp.]
MNTFADRLRFARTLRNLTQAQLARASGISQSAIANYEGNARLFPKSIFRLAAALRVSAHWLAEGVGPMEYDAPALAISRLGVADGTPRPAVSDWPFRDISPEIFWSLSDADRTLVENTIASLIASLLNKPD